ncbi:MAG: LLM class F420-dependent oxidoreductase [Chloroflexi bacterium]|nr:LLM class F420-dependent oxidoreductase [Chloroflexota bacterium]
MQFGVMMFPTDYAIGVVDLGRAAEEHGFESLFLPEHTHIPTSRRTPWPGGAELPQQYWHTLDPFVALTAVAAATERLRLGTGICLVIERDPITLAKEVASVDLLSGGRLLFGIGGGWNREEMENHGTDPRKRWRVLRERVLAMKAIWTEDEPQFHGEYVDFDPIWQWPKPVQRPHPPIIMGGDGPKAVEGLIEYCDEWLPRPDRGEQPLADRIADVNRLAAQAGRGPIPVSIFGASPDPKQIEAYEAAGAIRCVFGLPAAGADEVLPRLARYAEVIRSFR